MVDKLTPRQIEILDLVKLGWVDKQIAFRLGIVQQTVKTLMSREILPRLGAANRAHAVYLAMKRGDIR